jgi:type II secretory pathway pseudopilin PulG
MRPVAPRCRGFTYLALLFGIAVSGVLLAATGVLWRTDAVREREAELLFIGGEFQRALESYFQSAPQQPRRYPKALEELLEDRRGPVVRRHLRRLYADPFTGKPDWVLVRAPDGTITGVHSSSEAQPVKRGDAWGPFAFAQAKTYRDWLFAARSPAQIALGQGAGEPGGAAVPIAGAAATTSPVAVNTGVVPVGTGPPGPQVVIVAPGKPPPEPTPEKPPALECISQRVADGKTCQDLRATGNIEAAGRCLISASQRFLACERGQSLPPLRLQ